MLNNLSGIGAVQEALTTTNELLADVLAELRETNAERLAALEAQLTALNAMVAKIEERTTPPSG